MTPPLRTLLTLSDPGCSEENRRLALRRLPPSFDPSPILMRIRRVVATPLCVAPEDELDPNLLAEYLDYQLSPEDQDSLEGYCLKSDAVLAELVCAYNILTHSLKNPVRSNADCRHRIYRLGKKSTLKPHLAGLEPWEKDSEAYPNEHFEETENVPEPYLSSGRKRKIAEEDSEESRTRDNRVKESLDQWERRRQTKLRVISAFILVLTIGAVAYRNQDHFFPKETKSSQVDASRLPALQKTDTGQTALQSVEMGEPRIEIPYSLKESAEKVFQQTDPGISARTPQSSDAKQVPAPEPTILPAPAIRPAGYSETKN